MAKKRATSKTKKEVRKKISKQKPVKKEKKYTYDLFGFIKTAFTDSRAYNKIHNYEKNHYYFMWNRFMSIKYPLQAFMLSRVGIYGAEVINYWQDVLSQQYNRVPGWMYIKTKKKVNASNKKEWEPKSELVKLYMKQMQIDQKTYDETIFFYKDEFYEELKTFEKIVS